MKKNELRVHDDKGFDIEQFKKGFSHWIDKFKVSVLDEEFQDGISEVTETDEKLTFKFTSEWLLKIERVGDSK